MADLSRRERRRLLNILTTLPSPIFGEVVFTIGVSAGIVPDQTASQGDRAFKLVEWAETPGIGCGLPALKETVEEIVADYNYNLPPDDDDEEESETTGTNTSSSQANSAPATSQSSSVVRDQVFVSYSHDDSEWLKRLQVHLTPLVRSGAINLWDDTQISPGDKWRDEINNALARAKVALLLVSPSFLSSDFIDQKELPKLLAAEETEGLKVIWVPISFSLYDETAIGQYQAAHSPGEPLDSLSVPEQNRVLVKIAKVIRDALQT